MSVGLAMLSGAACLVAYAYLGFPAILYLLAWRRTQCASLRPKSWPNVVVVMPVYNEERTVAGALEAVLALDYPGDRIQVLVISDCSTDRTDSVVAQFAARGVKLVRLPRRGGKTAAENEARNHLGDADIVVSTDASVRLAVNSLKPIVAAFADPTVGIASGRDVSVARLELDPSIAESGYVAYEMWVRHLETSAGGIVGASGCLFASRIEVYTEVVPHVLSRDFAGPLIARERGFRSVSVNAALCFVPRTISLRSEYRRKVRTMACGLLTLLYKRSLMNPIRHGRFAWVLISHKLVRWLVPWAACLAGFGLVVAARHASWARLACAGVGIMLGLAVVGWLWPVGRRMPRFVAVPAYFVWATVAGIAAWVKVLSGDSNPIWEPTRREAS